MVELVLRRLGLLGRCTALLSALLAAPAVIAAEQEGGRLTIAATPTIEQSGILDNLLLGFQSDTGIHVQLVPTSETNPFETGRQGNADVLLVTESAEADNFIREGFGLEARPVFYTDFVLVGPSADPANCGAQADIVSALRQIARAGHRFVSRGGNTPTTQREDSLWRAAGIDPANLPDWHQRLDRSAHAILEAATANNAYTLVRRLAWTRLITPSMRIIVEGDPRLFRGVRSITVDPKRFEQIHGREAQVWQRWLLAMSAQQEIALFRVEGQQVFFPVETRIGANWP